jgi:hypothetical protein
MQRFTQPIEAALQAQAWMPALMSSLVLPDICGWLETPEEGVGTRYKRWAEQWVQPKYTAAIGARQEQHVFLSAGDLYALRCAILHSGLDDITTQRAKEALSSFVFLIPPRRGRIHCNQSGGKLQLQIDVFCSDICDAVSAWTGTVTDQAIQDRIGNLIRLQSFENGFSF